MADNTHWLRRVLFKLNELFLEGSDFNDRRWIFDWSENTSLSSNLQNVYNEDRALETLTQANVIESRSIENFYRNQKLDADEELEIQKQLNPHIPDDYENTVWGDWHTTDAARREYDWLRLLDKFHYDNFLHFCALNGFNPSSAGVIARLELKNGVNPIVIANDERFVLPTLPASSVTQKIIAYAAKRFDTLLDIEELRSNLKNSPQIQADDVNLRQVLKKNPFNGVLAPFADITPKSIRLKQQALLTPAELEEIRQSSTH